MYRIPARPNQCVICGRPGSAHCYRCDRVLCAGCTPRTGQRCYPCENEFSTSRQSRRLAVFEMGILPLLTLAVILCYVLTQEAETMLSGVDASAMIALMLAPVIVVPLLWTFLRRYLQRGEFMEEQVAAHVSED